MFTNLCYWRTLILAFITVSTNANLQALYINRLDLTTGVGLFEKCYVHLIQAHFEIIEVSNKSYDKSYELAPFQFPIVLNQYNFKIREYPDWSRWEETDGIKPCMRLNPKLTENSWRNFAESVPQQKRSQPCTVILYIDPPICDGPPMTDVPPGFTFTLHNDIEFHRGNDNMKAVGLNQFIVHIGRPQYPWAYKVLETWYSANQYDCQFHPVVIHLRLNNSEGKTELTNIGHLATCPNHEAYHRLTKREYARHLQTPNLFSLQSNLICSMRFLKYLYNQEMEFNTSRVKSWHDLISIRDSYPCEHRTLLLKAATLNDLPRKFFKTEYLLDWMDRVGSVVHIFTRIFLLNMTYMNDDELRSLDTNIGINTFYGYAARSAYWINEENLLKPISVLVSVSADSGIKSELFYHSTINDQVKFVMCSYESQTGGLSLLGFVSAFRWDVWAALAATVVLGAGLFQTVVNNVNSLKYTRRYKVVQEIWSILLAQGTRRLSTNKWFYGSWALAGLVLTNAYLGDNINTLTAPLPILTWDTFPQILKNNLTVHSPRIGLADAHNAINMIDPFAFLGSLIAIPEHLNQGMNDFQDFVKNKILGNHSVFGTLYVRKHFNESYPTVEKRLGLIESNASDIYESIKAGHYLSIASRCLSEPYVDVWSNVVKVKLQLLQKIANGTIKATPDNVVVSKKPYGNVYQSIQLGLLRLNPEYA